MDYDEILYINDVEQSAAWLAKLRECRPELPAWVSDFHSQKLPCKPLHESDEHRSGSYNWIIQFVFTHGEEWIVRFPNGPKVKHPDKKVEAEVSTLKLIRDETDIPVPEVKAWGLAAENKFGLGPFIMMSVIKGIDLESILRTPDSKVMRQDIGGVAATFSSTADYFAYVAEGDLQRKYLYI
jgi:aminoglycoside phosphotransferase (APT) family kinase protein